MTFWFVADGVLIEDENRECWVRSFGPDGGPVAASRRIVLPHAAFVAAFDAQRGGAAPVEAIDPTPAPVAYLSLDDAAAKLGISRDTVDRMIRAAPDLPGAPVNFGTPRKQLLRFRADALDAWVAAYRAWTPRGPQARAPKRPVAKKKRSPRAPMAGGDGTGKITVLEVERRRRR